MTKAYLLVGLFFVLAFLSLATVSAYPLLNGSATGAAGVNYTNNFYNLTNNFLKPQFNVTQVFVSSTGPVVLWVPWYTSSSFCNVIYLHTDSFAVPNMTFNTMVTDEFSELGLLFAQSNNQTLFSYWDNTVHQLNLTAYGQLPCWKATRNDTVLRCDTTDTAEDASVRIGLAYFYAAKNPAFDTTNRSYYSSMGVNITRDHLLYEVNTSKTFNSSVTGSTITYMPFSGATAATTGYASTPQFYLGYYPESVKLLLAAYNVTSNATYLVVADDYVDGFLVASNYSGGTTQASFKAGVLNFNWNITINPTLIINSSGVTQYNWAFVNAQWDDSDAPRASGMCDVLRVANISYGGTLPGAYRNLSNYCEAWSNSGTYNNTKSCLQYYFNGTCATSIRTGYYENGLGAGTHTYWSIDGLQSKLNESLTHYTFNSANTYDSAACYGVYRGVRPPKSLADAIGLNDNVYGYAVAASAPAATDNTDITEACSSLNTSLVSQIGLLGVLLSVLLVGGVIMLLRGDLAEMISLDSMPSLVVTVTATGLLIVVGIYVISSLGGC